MYNVMCVTNLAPILLNEKTTNKTEIKREAFLTNDRLGWKKGQSPDGRGQTS